MSSAAAGPATMRPPPRPARQTPRSARESKEDKEVTFAQVLYLQLKRHEPSRMAEIKSWFMSFRRQPSPVLVREVKQSLANLIGDEAAHRAWEAARKEFHAQTGVRVSLNATVTEGVGDRCYRCGGSAADRPMIDRARPPLPTHKQQPLTARPSATPSPNSPDNRQRPPVEPPPDNDLPLHTLDLQDALPSFLCPITGQVMRDPVMASDGYCYDKEAILAWFTRRGAVSPVTNAALASTSLTTAHTVRHIMQDYCTVLAKKRRLNNAGDTRND